MQDNKPADQCLQSCPNCGEKVTCAAFKVVKDPKGILCLDVTPCDKGDGFENPHLYLSGRFKCDKKKR